MSYCRWSSDSFQSDVYCFAHVDGGITIYVASCRRESKIPRPPDGDPINDTEEEFVKKHEALMEWLKQAGLVPIGLPYDGATFVEPNERAAAERLLELRSAGYWVPQRAIDRLLEEANEKDQTEAG